FTTPFVLLTLPDRYSNVSRQDGRWPPTEHQRVLHWWSGQSVPQVVRRSWTAQERLARSARLSVAAARTMAAVFLSPAASCDLLSRSDPMNKSDLVQEISNRTGMSKADATRAIDSLFDPESGLIPEALKRGDRVQISGFGTFETRERKARTGRTPRTGTEIRIGPTVSASFRPGKAATGAVRPAWPADLLRRWPAPAAFRPGKALKDAVKPA